MQPYLDLVRRVLTHGHRKENRTGVDTLAAFNINYTHDLADGFPLLTTKQISWKNIVVENLWFLSGQPHIELLRRHGCRFWDPWADEAGYVPSAYGHLWRRFPVPGSSGGGSSSSSGSGGGGGGGGSREASSGRGSQPTFNDQIRWVLKELRRNPNSRRLVVTAWEPTNAQTSALPPCHLLFILNVQHDGPEGRPRLNLHLTQRSCDIALGVPYNLAGYALLLHLFARFAGLEPGVFAHTLVDAHIYTSKADGSMAEYDHAPGLRAQLGREPRPLPRLTLAPELQTLDDLLALTAAEVDTAALLDHFRLTGYDPHPPINFKVAV